MIGGLGGGPWLDGRVRMGFAAIGYLAAALDDEVDRYANVAQVGTRRPYGVRRRRPRRTSDSRGGDTNRPAR